MNASPTIEEMVASFDTLEKVEAALLDFDRFDCEESLYTFVKSGWPNIDPAPWQDGWPLEAVAEHLEAVVDGQIKRLVINQPPRTSKSSFASVALPAWCWAQPAKRHSPTSGPQVQFLHASYANKLALRDSVKCRRLIQSPWYQRRWGLRYKLMGDQNAKTRFGNDKGGERLITSVDSGTTGEGMMIGILDDPNDASDVASESALQTAIDWWDGTMQTRLNDPKHGAFIVVQQRLAEDDLTGHILSKEAGDWTHLCYDDQTEILSRRGWVKFGDLAEDDDVMGVDPTTLAATWERPTRYIRERYVGEMISYKSQTTDLLVTPDHRMVYGDMNDAKGSYPSHWRVRPAAELPTNFLLPQVIDWKGAWIGPVWFGNRSWDPMVFAEFMGWYLSEGCSSAKRRTTRIVQRKDGPHVADIERVMAAVPFHVGSHMNNERMRVWQIADRFLARELEPLGKSLTKRAPAILKELSPECLRAFLIAYAKGDGHFAVRNSRKITITSGSRRMADDLHECTVKAGWAASAVTKHIKGRSFNGYLMPNSVQHQVYIRASKAEGRERKCASQIRPCNTTRVAYDGMVYCVSVPSSAVVVRRNGRVAISGNCLPMFYEPQRYYTTSIGWTDPRTKEGELLWPERFGEKEARDLERRLGPWRAAGQLQQRPEPDGGGIIKRDWWMLWEADAFPPMDFVLASLDTAYTEKQQNDACAMTIWGVFQGSSGYQASRVLGPDGRPIDMQRAYQEASPKVVLMYCWNERLEFHALVEKTAKTCRQFGVDKLLVENKANGISVAQELRRLYGNEPWMVQLNDPKGQDKTARLHSVQHLFAEMGKNDKGEAVAVSSGMIYAPDRKWAEEAITQVAQFPVGKHDDIVDTVSQGLRHLRDLGMLERSQERLEQIEQSKQYSGRPPEPLYPG